MCICDIREKEQHPQGQSSRQRPRIAFLAEKNQALAKELHNIKAQLKREQRERAMDQARIADLEARARFNLFSSDLSSDPHPHPHGLTSTSTSTSCWSLEYDARQSRGIVSAAVSTPSAWWKQFETLNVLLTDDVDVDVRNNGDGDCATRRDSTGTSSSSSQEDSTVSTSAVIVEAVTSKATLTSTSTSTPTSAFGHATTFQKPLNRSVAKGASVASETSLPCVSPTNKKHVVRPTSESESNRSNISKSPRAWLKQLETLNHITNVNVSVNVNDEYGKVYRHRNSVWNDRTCHNNRDRNIHHASGKRNKEHSSSFSAVVEAAPTHQHASASTLDVFGHTHHATAFQQNPWNLFARGSVAAAGRCASVASAPAPETRAPTQHHSRLGFRAKDPAMSRRSSDYDDSCCPLLFSSNHKPIRRTSQGQKTTNAAPKKHNALLCPSTLQRLGDQMDQWDSMIPMTCTSSTRTSLTLLSSHDLEKRMIPIPIPPRRIINKDTIIRSTSVYGTANHGCHSKSCSCTRTRRTTTCSSTRRPSLLSLLRRGGAGRSGGASMTISRSSAAAVSTSSRRRAASQIKDNQRTVMARAPQTQPPPTTIIERATPTFSAATAAVTSDVDRTDAMDR
jgi:hypothetical protein